MEVQDNEPNQYIDRSLMMLIGGLTQNNVGETYEGYKALFQVGTPAVPQIRAAVLKSNWSKLKYPNEVRYVSGLVNLIHDIDETEARRITIQLKNNGCDIAVASILDSICAITLADYTRYNVCGVKIFEHKKLVTKQNVRVRLEHWLKNVPIEDLKEIERIYILRRGNLKCLGNYRPILYLINLVWDNPSPRWSPMSWLNNFIIESTLYHEIGHHVHGHTFGQDPDQEREAEKYSDKIMANSNHLPFSMGRLLSAQSNRDMKTNPVKLLVIIGALLLAAGSAAGLDVIHVPASGDAKTLFSGAMLLYWAFVFFITSRDSGYWTRFPNRQRDARFLAIGLGVLGVVLALMGLGLIG